jgi:DNA modification methylase
MYNEGLTVKQIMQRFSAGGRLICTWGVIEKEIRRLAETPGISLKIPQVERVQRWKPGDPGLQRTTVWSFEERGAWAVHTNEYRGNWSPYVPRNIIKQYTKKGDWILDGFVGGGTSLIESWLLGRNCVGIDISARAIAVSRKRLNELGKHAAKMKFKLPKVKVFARKADARDLGFIKDGSIDLVCSHPPYANALRYTYSTEGDLSHISKIDVFCDEMEKVASEFNRVLKINKRCAILLGDVRRRNMVVPLAYKVLERFLRQGFELEDIIMKTQHHDRSNGFFRGRPRTRFRFRISHEYLFVMKKLV